MRRSQLHLHRPKPPYQEDYDWNQQREDQRSGRNAEFGIGEVKRVVESKRGDDFGLERGGAGGNKQHRCIITEGPESRNVQTALDRRARVPGRLTKIPRGRRS